MRRSLLICVCAVPVLLLAGAGCGWLSSLTTPRGANREACEAYVAHMNTLQECMNISYDADNLCSGVDGAPVDMGPWYACLRENARCDGTEPVLSLEGCTPPLLSMGGSVGG